MFTIEVTREAGKVTAAKIIPDAHSATRAFQAWPKNWENRNDWKTYEVAAEVAAALNQSCEDLHTTYQAIDNGPYVSPRYDVIDLPQIGQEVSYAFNGDYYPCGKIKSISSGPGFRKIVAGPDFTGKDRTFWRRCRDGKPIGGAWVYNQTWSMIQGIHNKLSREF